MADKTEAQKQRESIKVESNQPEAKDENKDDTKLQADDEVKEEKDDKTESKEETKAETKEEEIEASEQTEEDLEKEKLEAKTQREKDRVQKKIDKEVAKRKALEDENKELKRKLAEKPDDEKVLTEDDVEKRAEEKAKLKDAERQFVNACNRIADAAKKVDKDFKTKVDAMAEDIGPIPSLMIGILDDIDNGGEVLSYLTNNVDEAEEIYALPEGKMTRRLDKIAAKLTEEKKKPKPISKAPKPNEPVNGNRASPDTLTGKESMEDFVRIRAAQVEARRKARLM